MISGIDIGGNTVESVMKVMEKVEVSLDANDFEGAYVIRKKSGAETNAVVETFIATFDK